MIFAAGKGTRLGHITSERPKALVEVNGIPLLGLIIEKMKFFGINEIVVNVHHYSEQITAYLKSNYSSLNIHISDESAQLLDTGGALLQARPFFGHGEPILLHNTDILTDIAFDVLENEFSRDHAEALLLVSERSTSRKLLFDKDMQLCGWTNLNTSDEIRCRVKTEHEQALAFSGISIIKPGFSDAFTRKGVFGLVPAMLDIGNRTRIVGYESEHRFLDVGKPDALESAKNHLIGYYQNYLS